MSGPVGGGRGGRPISKPDPGAELIKQAASKGPSLRRAGHRSLSISPDMPVSMGKQGAEVYRRIRGGAALGVVALGAAGVASTLGVGRHDGCGPLANEIPKLNLQ